MKDTIYTIPVTDAFNSDDECPFCYIKRQLEQDAISFTLGCAYMEDDIRAETDEMGFCAHHYKQMYDYGNRLGNALILHTHYKALEKELAKKIEAFTPTKTSLFAKLKKPKSTEETSGNVLSDWAKEKTASCYICNRINKNFSRYINTFFYLMETKEEFRELFKNSKGFCIPHFGEIMALADTNLSDQYKATFYELLFEKMQTNLKRIEEDLSWFIDKYDYKNKDADWKNSKDAIPRGMQKVGSLYPQDPPFKEK